MAKSGYLEIKGKCSLFGRLALWSFIGFNLLMIAWLAFGLRAVMEAYQEMSSA